MTIVIRVVLHAYESRSFVGILTTMIMVNIMGHDIELIST